MSGEIIVPDGPDHLAEVDREGLDLTKLRHFFAVVLKRQAAGADAYLDRFADFDVTKLRELTGKALRNVLLDVDDCIAPHYGPIYDENLGHIDNLKRAGMNFGVYSNCKGMDRLDPLREMGIPIYSGRHAKPSAAGFLDVCKTMNFDPAETWMVDDNPLTGGGAVGVLEGMAFVKPLGLDPQYVSPMQMVKLLVAGIFRDIAIARTLQGNTKIHRLPTP